MLDLRITVTVVAEALVSNAQEHPQLQATSVKLWQGGLIEKWSRNFPGANTWVRKSNSFEAKLQHAEINPGEMLLFL